MPPNVAIATSATPAGLDAPAAHYNENDVFTWEQVYHYVCK